MKDLGVATTPVLGDDRLLQRLVANVVDNAIRHNTPGGRIDIQVTADGEQPSLMITNTGLVIPAEQVAGLLQPFQRLTARPADGDGLGLELSIVAAVAAVAKAHHATLTISPGTRGSLDIGSFPPAIQTIPNPQAALATA